MPTLVSAWASVARSPSRRARSIARVPSAIASRVAARRSSRSCAWPLSAIASSLPGGRVSSSAIARSPAPARLLRRGRVHHSSRDSQRRLAPVASGSPPDCVQGEDRAARLERALRPAAQVRLDRHALERLVRRRRPRPPSAASQCASAPRWPPAAAAARAAAGAQRRIASASPAPSAWCASRASVGAADEPRARASTVALSSAPPERSDRLLDGPPGEVVAERHRVALQREDPGRHAGVDRAPSPTAPGSSHSSAPSRDDGHQLDDRRARRRAARRRAAAPPRARCPARGRPARRAPR